MQSAGVTFQLANQKDLLLDWHRVQRLQMLCTVRTALRGQRGLLPSQQGLLHYSAPCRVQKLHDTSRLFLGCLCFLRSAKPPIHLEGKLQDLPNQLLRKDSPLLRVAVPQQAYSKLLAADKELNRSWHTPAEALEEFLYYIISENIRCQLRHPWTTKRAISSNEKALRKLNSPPRRGAQYCISSSQHPSRRGSLLMLLGWFFPRHVGL